jgi:hypothetical protein
MQDEMLLNCFKLFNIQNTSSLASHNHMLPPDLSKLPPPNLHTSGTKIKHAIAWWIALLIMEDGGCSLTFAEVTNPNIIIVATKSTCIIHTPN